MAKKKVNRAEAARRGTKADPGRVEPAQKKAPAPEVSRYAESVPRAKDGRPVWYVRALNPERLNDRERRTRTIYQVVELLLCLALVADMAIVVYAAGGFSDDALQTLFSETPSYIITLIIACLQPVVMLLVRTVRKHYEAGDTGYVISNLVGLLCAEILMQSIIGIVGMVLLLWRSWDRCVDGLSDWADHRGVGGIFRDLLAPIALIVVLVALMLVNAFVLN